MHFNENIDIVKFFRMLVQDLKPYASTHEVALSFQTKIGNSGIKHYDNETVKHEITKFIKQILVYMPQNHKVNVLFDICKDDGNCCLLTITNTGINMYRIMEITESTKFKAKAKSIDSNSTEFTVEVPLLLAKAEHVAHDTMKINLQPYYSEMGKRLSTHFTKSNHFLPNTYKINKKESTFLQKVNIVMSSKLEDNTFTVEKFAAAMAMSRTQLFRKMKALTNMAPSKYILFFRLQAAKELLEAKDLELNISDVCYSTGFMSKSHFTRSFRNQFGILPSQIKY